MDNRAEQINSRGCVYFGQKDYVSAFKFFSEAARLGDYNGVYNVGYCYFNGYGVQKDMNKAIGILSKVALQPGAKQADAQYICGLIMYSLSSDREKAQEWFTMAAEKGHAWANYQLGVMSMGNKRDLAKYHFKEAMRLASNDYELQIKAKKMYKAAVISNFFG